MDPATNPPEKSMYLSVLQEARLHREGPEGWAACIPGEDEDICHVRPVLLRMQEVLEAAKGGRVKVISLFAEMRSQPYGVRDGLCPLLLAAFAVIHEQDLAFYDQNSFMKQVTGQEFHRLIKAPENFEVQYCRIVGLRTVVFEQLFKVLHPDKKPKSIDLLDVVRPLCIFAAQLPEFAKRPHVSRARLCPCGMHWFEPKSRPRCFSERFPKPVAATILKLMLHRRHPR